MHYYNHNIKSFNNATRHLTRVERSLYRDLIELYYDDEQPLQAVNFDRLARRVMANTDEEKEALQYVLDEFFTETDEGFTHAYCERVIAQYYEAKANHWGKTLSKAQRSEMQARRNAAKINATPLWLLKEDREELKKIYEARDQLTFESGIPHEVDHIVPLLGINVCGLHVPWNLQIIPAHENRKKSNRWNP